MVRAYQVDENLCSTLHVVINIVHNHNMMYYRGVIHSRSLLQLFLNSVVDLLQQWRKVGSIVPERVQRSHGRESSVKDLTTPRGEPPERLAPLPAFGAACRCHGRWCPPRKLATYSSHGSLGGVSGDAPTPRTLNPGHEGQLHESVF